MLACWLAQPGIIAGAGTIAGGIKFGSLRQYGILRPPLGDRRIRVARGAGHRDPGDRIAQAVGLNGPAVGRSVPAGLVVVPKFQTFGRSVPAGLVVAPKFQMLGRSVLVVDPKARTFGRSVPAGLVVAPKFPMFGRSVLGADLKARTFGRSVPAGPAVVPKSRAFGLKGLRLVLRVRVVDRVLGVHNDPAMRLTRAADIVTKLDGLRRIMLRGHISRRDNNPAMQFARVAGIVTTLVRVRISRRDNSRSTRRGPGRLRRGVPERSPRDKVTKGTAIALRGEGDLGSSKNMLDAQCSHRVTVARTRRSRMRDYITFVIVAVCAVIGAGLFRVGLHLKSESHANTRRTRQFITVGVAFLFAAVLILVLEAMKLSPATW